MHGVLRERDLLEPEGQFRRDQIGVQDFIVIGRPDRRNGADTTGNSSFTADDMRRERESQYRNPAPTDSRGTTWDANQTFGAAQRAVGLPGALISTGEGLVNTWQHGQEAADLRGDVNDSIDGPSNDDSARWANRNGGQW